MKNRVFVPEILSWGTFLA